MISLSNPFNGCIDSMSTMNMTVESYDWDDTKEECVNVREIGYVSGVLVAEAMSEPVYECLDAMSSDLEGMGSMLSSPEFAECEDNDLRGYLLLTNFYVIPEYENTGLEQSCIKTLISTLGKLVSGVVVHPIKEIREVHEKDGYVHITYDHGGDEYIKKIFYDMHFIPIENEPYWIHWTTLKSPRMDDVPNIYFFEPKRRLRLVKEN